MVSASGTCRAAVAVALITTGGAASISRADVALSLYGDVDGGIQTTGMRTGTSDGFSAGLFTTASSGNWSFLAETLFEVSNDNEFGVDVERLQISIGG